MKNQYIVTAEGLKKLKDELDFRKNVKKPEIQKSLEEARAQGDLRENDGYALASEDLKANESEIQKLTNLIKNAKVVKAVKKDTIEIGDTIVVQDSEGRDIEFKIGGENESDPSKNVISNNSPLGKALMGKKLGDKVSITTPRGTIEYTVKGV